METLETTQYQHAYLDQKLAALIERRTRLLQSFARAAEARKSKRMETVCRQLQQTNEFLESLEKIRTENAAGKPAASSVRKYVVSSLFLHQCFKDLTADQNEQFFFITGSEVEGRFVLDQKAEFVHSKRNAVGVTGNTSATHKLLIKLEQFGHRLLAHFHSHPGTGVTATQPSGTDEGFQKRLESAGYPTVAAIFSRDGFVRFFRLDKDVQIHIHGSGVEEIGPHTYKLTQIHQA